LGSNKISYLRNYTFQGAASLESLVLEKNQIVSIEYECFANLTSLKSLNIKENQLAAINFGLNSMKILTYLDISYNRLINIKKFSFINLNNLKTLNLSHNYLDDMSENYFPGLINLALLDLSFNSFKYLNRNFFNHLDSLETLFLNNNGLKTLETHSFVSLVKLKCLNLGSNEMYNLGEETIFFNLFNLNELSLNWNRLNSCPKLIFLRNLESIDLSYNQIEFVDENYFNFSSNLKAINLNFNSIKSFSLLNAQNLTSLKLAGTKLLQINMSEIVCENLIELDLSFNRVSLDKMKPIKLVRKLKFENTIFVGDSHFNLNSEIVSVDLSGTSMTKNLSSLKLLTKLEVVNLRHGNITSMQQLKLENYLGLKQLDLSFNALTHVNADALVNAKNLELLDLSKNLISFVDEKLFAANFFSNLKFLNLGRNLIRKLTSDMSKLTKLYSLKVSHNQLELFPNLNIPLNVKDDLVKEIYFDHNNLTFFNSGIFTLATSYVEHLTLAYNQISLISNEAFFFLKSLVNLSLSNNNLTYLNRNHLLNLFNLKYLNLSYNLISTIESNSFQNLNKLKVLDLSFNRLLVLDNYLFSGLNSLGDLYLFTLTGDIRLKEKTFSNLTSIRNIFLNELLIVQNKCYFMQNIDRSVQRNVNNGTYTFYKSLNLLSQVNETNVNCDFKFQYLQVKIHFNLKLDREFDEFYEECKMSLIKTANTFKNAIYACSGSIQEELYLVDELINTKSSIEKVITNLIYLIIMFVLLFYLGLVFSLILIHLVYD
jgi:Leucine-rich repeat (LRR) protein